MVTVAAVRALEQIDAPQSLVNVNIEVRAGYVIDLSEQGERVVDVTPLPKRDEV